MSELLKYTDKEINDAAKRARAYVKETYRDGVRGLSATATRALICQGIDLLRAEILSADWNEKEEK
jgi:hypothetical protein